MIIYYKHDQVDYKRWDSVITNSQNGLVYALSWYLDIVSPGWEALIEDDYLYVMPLPVKYKFFLPYLVQPIFTQQLGIFSSFPMHIEKTKEFLHKIPHKFLRSYINLNSKNPINTSKIITPLINYELRLNKPYEELWNNFNDNTQRNIKKADKNDLILKEGSVDTFMENYQQFGKVLYVGKPLSLLRKIITDSITNNSGEIYLIYNEAGYCLAGAFFLHTLNRIIYLVSFLTEEGKNSAAMFLIFNIVIINNAKTEKLLHFDGSTIPGIARFFEGFGATKEFFPIIRKQSFLFLTS